MNKKFIGGLIIAGVVPLSLLNAASNGTANLIPGDTDAEIETHCTTSGLFSNSSKRAPRWRHVTTTGYNSDSSILLVQSHTGMGVYKVKLPRGTYTFSYYAKATTPQSTGFIGVTSNAQNWPQVLKMRRQNAVKLTTQWRRYQVVFEADGQHFYSGYYGCRESGVYFDRFMINCGTTPKPWISSSRQTLLLKLPKQTGHVFFYQQKIPLQILLTCYTPARPTGEITCTVTDFSGQCVHQQKIRPIFDADGQFIGNLELQLNRSGWFKIDVQQAETRLRYFTTLVLTRPPEPLLPEISPFVGLCGIEKSPKTAQLIGVKWLQIHVFWDALERERGKFDFSSLNFVPELKKQGFKIQALITSHPPLWSLSRQFKQKLAQLKIDYTKCVAPKAIQDRHYRPLMREFMKRYGNLIDVYELGGELDALLGLNVYYKSQNPDHLVGPFVLGESYDQICHMMSIAAEEIQQAQPQAKISSVRPSDVDARHRYIYSREIFKRLGQYMNCFGIDCYPQPRWIGPGQPETGTEQQLTDRLRDSRKAMHGLVKSDDVIISEYGYFIDVQHLFTPRYSAEQVNRLARSYLKARLLGMKALFYYTTEKVNLEGQHYYMGLWYDTRPLAAVAALNNVGRIVENVTACQELGVNQKIGLGVFRKYDNRAVAAIWSIDSNYTPEIEFPDDDFEITDVMGNPVQSSIANGKTTLRLSPLPHYIWKKGKANLWQSFKGATYAPTNYEKLRHALEQLEIKEACPLTITLRMASRHRLKAYLQNHSLKKTISGYVVKNQGQRGTRLTDFTVPPHSLKTVELPLPAPGQALPLKFHFSDKYPATVLNWITPQLQNVPRISPAQLNHDLAPWRGVKPVRISGKSHIHPVDHTTYNGVEDLSAKIYLAHDGQYLYFAAQVTDDRHFNRFDSRRIWRGDCVQLGIDPEMNFIRQVNGLDADDVTLSCGRQNNQAVLKVHHSPQQYTLQQRAQYQVSRDETQHQTLYLIKLPLKELGKNLRPGAIFGFNCIFMDDDTNSGADYWLFWRQGLAGGLRPDRFVPCILQ